MNKYNVSATRNGKTKSPYEINFIISAENYQKAWRVARDLLTTTETIIIFVYDFNYENLKSTITPTEFTLVADLYRVYQVSLIHEKETA